MSTKIEGATETVNVWTRSHAATPLAIGSVAVTVTVYVPGQGERMRLGAERPGRRGVEVGVRRAIAPVDVHGPGLRVARPYPSASPRLKGCGTPWLAVCAAGAARLTTPKLEATAVPLFSNVSPTAGTGLRWCSAISVPVPLMLKVLPPGLAAVPRSTVPPLIRMAAWA